MGCEGVEPGRKRARRCGGGVERGRSGGVLGESGRERSNGPGAGLPEKSSRKSEDCERR